MIYAIAAVLVLILDQGLKYWVTVNIALDTGAIPLIPGILDLVNIHNTGAAFGILHGGGWRWVFVVIALAFVVIAVVALKRGLVRGALGRWAVVGVLAGAIGNCIDRVLYGYVVDMFKPVFLEGTPFGAIFNVADIFISCCGILFCLYILFSHEFKPNRAAAEMDGFEEPQPKQQRVRAAKTGARAGGSHAKSAGGHARSSTASRRAPAREARSEGVPRRAEQQSVPERTRIPVQQPRPQRPRPAQPRQARPIDPANPFAEWENPAPAPQPKQEYSRPADDYAQGAAEYPAPAQSAPKQDYAPRPQQNAPRPNPEHEFTLEEILAEFSDK